MTREGVSEDSTVHSDSEESVDVNDVLEQLEELRDTVTTPEGKTHLLETKRLLKRLPGGEEFEEQIGKYTSRDVGEAFVGSVLFALPLLVEDGVFVIADHLLEVTMWGVPVFLVANIAFVIILAAGLLYAVDIKEVRITNPLFGVIPRRLVGVLLVSFLTVAGMMVMWGRLFLEDPTNTGAFARITVIWAAASLGASLGDILPGESKGTDLTIDNLDDIILSE